MVSSGTSTTPTTARRRPRCQRTPSPRPQRSPGRPPPSVEATRLADLAHGKGRIFSHSQPSPTGHPHRAVPRTGLPRHPDQARSAHPERSRGVPARDPWVRAPTATPPAVRTAGRCPEPSTAGCRTDWPRRGSAPRPIESGSRPRVPHATIAAGSDLGALDRLVDDTCGLPPSGRVPAVGFRAGSHRVDLRVRPTVPRRSKPSSGPRFRRDRCLHDPPTRASAATQPRTAASH